jgi:hypothetical protein
MRIKTDVETLQLVAAVILTFGEWGGCICLLIHGGDWFSVYLAFTYFIRETRGGENYHSALLAGFQRITRRKRAQIAEELNIAEGIRAE